MGRTGENRLPFQLKTKYFPIKTFLIGVTVGIVSPFQILHNDAIKMLAPFLAILAASIMPSITLLIGAITSESKSVKRVSELGVELSHVINELLMLFFLILASMFCLVFLFIPSPFLIKNFIIYNCLVIALGQGVFIGFLSAALDKTAVIPKSLFKCMELKLNIAKDTSKSKTSDNANNAINKISPHISNPPEGFGKRTDISK